MAMSAFLIAVTIVFIILLVWIYLASR